MPNQLDIVYRSWLDSTEETATSAVEAAAADQLATAAAEELLATSSRRGDYLKKLWGNWVHGDEAWCIGDLGNIKQYCFRTFVSY